MFPFVCLLLFSNVIAQTKPSPPSELGSPKSTWRVTLKSPGGELPFVLRRDDSGVKSRAWIINGCEEIEVEANGPMRAMYFHFPQYDSVLDLSDTGIGSSPRQGEPALFGEFRKSQPGQTGTSMEAIAEVYRGYRFTPIYKITEEVQDFAPLPGRWSVKFADEAEPAVGVFRAGKGRDVEGTFLTTTGDYRYLAGSYEYGRLRLSCFDGAHAFLFDAMMQPVGTLNGDFWSGPKYHDTWTAQRNDNAALPDGFTLTKINPKARLKDLKFRDLDGRERSPGDPALLGKVTIIEVFGSWCPNCHDAAALLVDLEKHYGPKGLKVLGLAFEMTGNLERDAKQVRTYVTRHSIPFPILLAGTRDKTKASSVLPVIDGVKAYPTFLFVDANGEVRSAYSGFSGPATGEEHARLRRSFERVIERLLSDKR